VRDVIFENEKVWAKWKDEEKCPKMQLPPVDLAKKLVVAKTAELGTKKDDKKGEPSTPSDALLEMLPGLEGAFTISKSKTGKLVMGNPELGRLWALAPNLDVCADDRRNFAPNFAEYMNQMLQEEMNPDQFGEDARLRNDSVYVWRCLRLMQGEDFALFLKASAGIKAFCEHMVEEMKGNPTPKTEEDGKTQEDGILDEPGPKDKDTDLPLQEGEKEQAAQEDALEDEDAEGQAKKKRKRDGEADEEVAKKEKTS